MNLGVHFVKSHLILSKYPLIKIYSRFHSTFVNKGILPISVFFRFSLELIHKDTMFFIESRKKL